MLTKKELRLTVLVEFMVSAGMGIYFHWILHWEREAYAIFAIGMLLSLATYLVLEEIVHSRELVLVHYQRSHGLLASLNLIQDPECQERAHSLFQATERMLALLQKGYVPLDETEFYLEGARAMTQSKHKVQAVDPLTLDWDSRGALRNYYLANLQALTRGVRITRVFVIRRADLDEDMVQRVLHAQLVNGIDVRLAFLEELSMQGGDGAGRIGSGTYDFALYDGRVVTERMGPGASYFGCKTLNSAEVARYQRIFDIVAHNAHSVELKEERVAPADLIASTAAPLTEHSAEDRCA